MASNLRVDTILPSSGTTLGIGTASGTINFLGNSNLTTTGDVTVGGNLGVGGTLTYEDVTNIDSVGLITARSGVNVSGGEVKVGTAVTVSSGGVITSGIVTATNVSAASSVTAATFHGSGANLTGVSQDYVKISKAVNTGDTGSQYLLFDNLDLSTYKFFDLIGYFKPVDDSKTFRMRYRTGGASGSNADASVYGYGFTVPYPTNNTGTTSTDGANRIHLSTTVGNATGEGISINMRISFADSSDPTNATYLLNFVTWNGTYREQGNGFRSVTGTGQYHSAANNLTGFTVYFGSGNMGDYSYCLYGMKR